MKNKKLLIIPAIIILIIAVIAAIFIPKWQKVETWRNHVRQGIEARSLTLTNVKSDLCGNTLKIDATEISIDKLAKNGDSCEISSSKYMFISKYSNPGAGFYEFTSSKGEKSTVQVQLDKISVDVNGEKLDLPFEGLGIVK